MLRFAHRECPPESRFYEWKWGLPARPVAVNVCEPVLVSDPCVGVNQYLRK